MTANAPCLSPALDDVRVLAGAAGTLDPPALLTEKYQPPSPFKSAYSRAAPATLRTLSTIEIRQDFMPYIDGQVYTDASVFPGYVASYYDKGLVATPAAAASVRDTDVPLLCVSHFNMRTYGHFLLEVLPKILVYQSVDPEFAGARLPLPLDAGWVVAALRCIAPGHALLPYANRKETLRSPAGVFPSLVSSATHFHPLAVAEIRALATRLAAAGERPPGPRIFLSRAKHPESFRSLRNEQALADVAREFGFLIVSPETLSWPDQVRMLFHATHVVGEFTSALHGAMFAPAGCAVIALGWMRADVQSTIAAAFGHRISHIMPRNGMVIDYKHGWTEQQVFSIEPDDLRDCLAGCCD